MRTDMGRRLSAVVLLCALGAFAGAPEVVSVRVEGQDPDWGLDRLITLRPGGGLDPVEVRRSMQNLYDTGRLEQVEVVEEPAGSGVNIIFKVLPYPEVRKVDLQCVGCPRVQTVLPGTPCTPELLERIEGSISTRLAQAGYLHPAVGASCQEGILVVSGDRGERSRIGEVVVTADHDSAALAALQSLKGEPYRKEKIDARLASVQKRLLKSSPQADLRLTAAEETPKGIILRIAASGLTPVAFTASGDATGKDLAWMIRALRGEPMSKELLTQRADDLAERYRAQGYPQAAAAITMEESGTGQRAEVGLTLGPKFALGGILLGGAPPGEEAGLRNLLPPVEGQPYSAEEARVWQGILLEGLHRKGYLDAVVRGPDARLDAASGKANLTYQIEPGTQYLPAVVEVIGLPEGLDAPPLAVRANQPLVPDQVQADLETFQAVLDDAGYGNARVMVRKEPGRLGYAVEPGPRAVVDRLFFNGLWFTRPERIWPEVTLRAGRPVSFSKVLESQSRLYGTGLFASVDVRARTEPEDPERATVVLRVEETAPRSYTYGLGYDTYDGVRVQGGVYHDNLFGTRRAVGLEGRYSGKERQWRLFYREPTFFIIPYPIQVTVFQSLEQRPDFSLDKWGTTVELARTLGSRTKGTLRYAYEIQDASDITPGYPVPREDADKKVSSLGLGYIHDARDDPFYPTAGRFLSLNLRYAFPLRNATSHFFKVDLRGAGYLTPVRGGTLAVSARGGVIDNRLKDEEVPLGERFFLGGRDTVRAFSRDAVGVDGQTVVDGSSVGGNAFLLFNIEWRQRLASWIGVSLFMDSGQVWEEWGRVKWGDLHAGTGYGGGVFFFSPLGPIRIEYSRKLDPSAWDSRDQWYLGIGVPF